MSHLAPLDADLAALSVRATSAHEQNLSSVDEIIARLERARAQLVQEPSGAAGGEASLGDVLLPLSSFVKQANVKSAEKANECGSAVSRFGKGVEKVPSLATSFNRAKALDQLRRDRDELFGTHPHNRITDYPRTCQGLISMVQEVAAEEVEAVLLRKGGTISAIRGWEDIDAKMAHGISCGVNLRRVLDSKQAILYIHKGAGLDQKLTVAFLQPACSTAQEKDHRFSPLIHTLCKRRLKTSPRKYFKLGSLPLPPKLLASLYHPATSSTLPTIRCTASTHTPHLADVKRRLELPSLHTILCSSRSAITQGATAAATVACYTRDGDEGSLVHGQEVLTPPEQLGGEEKRPSVLQYCDYAFTGEGLSINVDYGTADVVYASLGSSTPGHQSLSSPPTPTALASTPTPPADLSALQTLNLVNRPRLSSAVNVAAFEPDSDAFALHPLLQKSGKPVWDGQLLKEEHLRLVALVLEQGVPAFAAEFDWVAKAREQASQGALPADAALVLLQTLERETVEEHEEWRRKHGIKAEVEEIGAAIDADQATIERARKAAVAGVYGGGKKRFT
ncbi:hypothetical protein JCM10213v2_004200 [Rhodosporidiobolus nylandii]